MALLPMPFGNPQSYPGHSGVDFPQPDGTPILASGPGVVGLLNNTTNGGYTTWIDYDDPGVGVAYAHQWAHYISVGTRVVEGTVIGYVGSSGHSTGPHLHIEIADQPGEAAVWRYFDPNRVVSGAGPVPPAGNQRTVGAGGANGRRDPSTNGPVTQTLPPGTLANFNGWINGQSVEGNAVWFRGEFSGDWFWSGGFTDTGTHDLADLNPSIPQDPKQRIVGPNGANGRNDPSTSGPVTQTLTPGTVADMDGWINGETVEGNSLWYRGAHSGNFFWSGGFTTQSKEGLPEVTAPPPTVDPDNPRDLPEYEPVYPGAKKGLEAPLGFHEDGTPALRTTSGSTPVSPIIDRYIIHHTATTQDQLDFFSYRNSRDVCPSYYMRTDGSMFELIRPRQKPAATGPKWNYRSIATETLNSTGAPDWEVTEEQIEAHAKFIAWLADYDGTTLDGVPVEFKIDREHVISHQEALPGTTQCPGPTLQNNMDYIVDRAKEIYDDAHPDPNPNPDDNFVVPRRLGNRIRRLVNQAFPKAPVSITLPQHDGPEPRNG